MNSSWDDLAHLRDNHGWTFIADSKGPGRPRMADLTDAEVIDQSCGSLPILESHGHTDAWGMFAFPSNRFLDHQADLVSDCFAFNRRYGTASYTQDSVAAPWWIQTYSAKGARCTNRTAPCFDLDVDYRPNRTSYTTREELLALMSPPHGTWQVVQFYRLVTGTSDETTPVPNTTWDCSSPDPTQHWTSRVEIYCLDDFLWVLDQIPSDVINVTAAEVAQSWGRGNPNDD